MKRFTDAGRQAIADGNLYVALSLALMIPDICASLEDPGPGKSKARYLRWCKQWMVPEYTTSKATLLTGKPLVLITEDQLYQLRCSLIHSGSDEIDEKNRTGIDRFFFFDQTRLGGLNKFEKCAVNGQEINIICLGAAEFCAKMFAVADEWDTSVAMNEDVQKEKAKLLSLYSKGAVLYGVIKID
jgi:hypothetical protein